MKKYYKVDYRHNSYLILKSCIYKRDVAYVIKTTCSAWKMGETFFGLQSDHIKEITEDEAMLEIL